LRIMRGRHSRTLFRDVREHQFCFCFYPEKGVFWFLLTARGKDFDTVHLEYSYKHSCLVTLTINLPNPSNVAGATPPPPQIQDQQWRLPMADMKNEGYYLTKLHTVDIYFWTRDDAVIFVESSKKVLPPTQVKILDAPQVPPAHRDAMSPVVQKLEQVAVTDPYRPVESESASADSPTAPGQPGSSNTHKGDHPSEPANYAPLAYNPAAPPAPEPIKHREQTPPPPDAAGGTGLAAAASSDHGQAFVPAPLQHQGGFPTQSPGQTQPYFTGPPQPQGSVTPQGQAGSPPQANPPFGKPQRTNTYPAAPPTTGSAGPPPGQQYAQGFTPPPTGSAGPPPGQQYAQGLPPPPATAPPTSQQYAQGFPPPPAQPQDPNAQLYGQAPPGPGQQPAPVQQGYPAQYYQQQPGQQYYGQQQQQQQQQPPIGGYSDYQYSSTGTPQQQPAGANEIHGQLYRPTQVEAGGSQGQPQAPPQPSGQPSGRLEAGVGKVEKGVGRFLKKLEKKIG
jgi:hypothetical protein